ncbi:MAG: hypothetical protein M0C28_00560 [Candidatus Moduliflexus flocculans]|nr:hypothetical protein [Candidatus Moduliflexus flocculans]
MPEAHLRTLRMRTQGNLPILEEVVQRSLADFNNIRREMFLVCIPFYKIMYPNIDIEQLGRTKGEEQTRNIVIQGVLDKIKSDHVAQRRLHRPRSRLAAAQHQGLHPAAGPDEPARRRPGHRAHAGLLRRRRPGRA